jgi:hypothetical protein
MYYWFSFRYFLGIYIEEMEKSWETWEQIFSIMLGVSASQLLVQSKNGKHYIQILDIMHVILCDCKLSI